MPTLGNKQINWNVSCIEWEYIRCHEIVKGSFTVNEMKEIYKTSYIRR